MIIDETGKRYGRWSVVARAPSRRSGSGRSRRSQAMWLCRCDCGVDVEVLGKSLRGGSSMSCGCLLRDRRRATYVDLTGQRFCRLVVLRRGDEKDRAPGNREFRWLCQCDCGTQTWVGRGVLVRNETTSCGCRRSEMIAKFQRKGPGASARRGAISSVLGAAKSRNHIVTLTEDQIVDLFEQPCNYCGVIASNRAYRSTGAYYYNGIDRIDNTVGYTVENCVTCCKQCNYAKRDMGVDDFCAWIRRAYEHMAARA